MTITKENLSDYKEQYEKAENLVELDSKHDPETEPFRSHYLARDILVGLQNTLKNVISEYEGNNGNEEDIRTYKCILGYIYKDTGRICVWTEELSSGETYLQQSIEILEPYKLDADCINAYLGALNQIGILWSNRQNAAKSKEYLIRSEELYTQFKSSKQTPLTLYDIFDNKIENDTGKGLDILEKTHTLTLYYMAQIIGTLGDLHKSAIYCHTTLKRQLQFDDYEPIDWALNAATLSQYFFTNNRNTESRHHLAAATYMMDKHEEQMYTPNMSDDERAAVREIFHHRSADIFRCWAKYGLNLLLESKNRLLNDDDVDTSVSDLAKPKENEILCKFESIDVSNYENDITDQYLLMFDDAKPVFLAVQTWLNRAKDYYSSESEASEYARIIQDLSSSYKYLAFYDFDESNQCKLHKRRSDLLEELLILLNETYYMAICRELWYELGLAYSTMLDIKLDAFDRIHQGRANPHVLNKINMLCNKSITKFQCFVNSYKDKKTAELQVTISVDEMEPILFAYFQIGRLYYKIMSSDRAMQISNTESSLQFYQLFVKGCEEHKAIGERLKGEYGVCKEMISLLPLKIKKLSEN